MPPTEKVEQPSPPENGAAPAAGASDWLVETTEKIRRLNGVVGATLHANDAPVAGLGPRTPEDAAAAALSPAARRLGEALGLGRLVLGVARGEQRFVLLISSRGHQLTVLLRADDKVESVKSQIRALLDPTH